MKPLTPYIVTKSSSDGTFIVGDIIWQSKNGDLNSVQGGGWISLSETENNTLDFECKESKEYEVVNINRNETIRRIIR